MTFVVTENCIKCKYMDCIEPCPVDCFYEGPEILVIDPDECIDCSVCVTTCPVNAIYQDTKLPEDQAVFLEINRKFSAIWPNAVQKCEALPDRDKWAEVAEKRQFLLEAQTCAAAAK